MKDMSQEENSEDPHHINGSTSDDSTSSTQGLIRRLYDEEETQKWERLEQDLRAQTINKEHELTIQRLEQQLKIKEQEYERKER